MKSYQLEKEIQNVRNVHKFHTYWMEEALTFEVEINLRRKAETNSAEAPSSRVLVARKRSAETGLARELCIKRKAGNASKDPSLQRTLGRRG